MREYLDFEVYISAPEGERYPISVRGPGGVEASGWLNLPATDGEFGGLVRRLRRLDTDEASLTTIGQQLFDALFRNAIRDVYASSQHDVDMDRGLRIRMNIAASAPRAAELPWEFMYDPDRGPLALLHAPVVRYIQQQDRLPSMAAPLPLKVLLTAAQTGAPIDTERELNAAAEALAQMGEKVEVTIEPHLTVDRFQQLARSGFHVWHFVGHGGYARDGVTGQLYFEAPNGETQAVSALQLGILLNRSGLRLVVLNACNSAQIATDPFRSMAPALIRAQIPAVIAMQFAVPGETTNIFTAEFYQTLTEGLPLDACVTEARLRIMNTIGLSRPDWGIPVVYVRSADARLFDPPTKAPAPALATPVSVVDNATIGAGMRVLRDLAQATGPMREAVTAFSTDFRAASEQIEVVSTYKDIHDQLHSLQVYCYNGVITETRRDDIDGVTWDNLLNYELTLQGIAEALRAISARSAQVGSELTWLKEITQAQTDLTQSIENLNVTQLKRSTRLIERVLNVQPTRINERLNAAARALRLPTLVQALSRIHERLPALELEPEKVAQFETAVLSIDHLSSQLQRLIADHDLHQELDLELRRIEREIDQDLLELELSWPDLKQRASPLYLENQEAWANAVRADAEKLDAALQANDPSRIRTFFRRYRRQMGDRFFRVDIELKRLCDDLRKVGDPLNALLSAIA
jgi:hypothetical protein